MSVSAYLAGCRARARGGGRCVSGECLCYHGDHLLLSCSREQNISLAVRRNRVSSENLRLGREGFTPASW